MSNPTILTEGFGGGLGVFSGFGAIRYDSGLWLEASATNAFTNPIAASGLTGLTDLTSLSVVTEVVSVPSALPGWLSGLVTQCWKVTATAPVVPFNPLIATPNTTFTAATYSLSAFVYVPSAFSATQVQLGAGGFTGGGVSAVDVNLSKRDQWQYVSGTTFTPIGTDVIGQAYIRLMAGTWGVGESVYIVGLQPELGAQPSSLVDSSFGTGYSASPSPHSRAASSASVTIAEPAAVACWYREGYGGAKTFAYIEPYGTLGTYGSIAWSGGTLTLSTTRNLVIGPFAAFDRALTANEQANLRSTQNWSMNSVNGSNIILPLSGRRRPR